MSLLEREICGNNICTWLSYWYTSHLEWILRQKQDWQENGYAHVQSRYYISCPSSQLLKLTLLTATLTSTLAASVVKHQSTTDSIAFKNATWFQATHKGFKGRVLWGQEMTNSDTASRQSVFTQFLNQPAKSFGCSSYILTFWEYTSSQASHC